MTARYSLPLLSAFLCFSSVSAWSPSTSASSSLERIRTSYSTTLYEQSISNLDNDESSTDTSRRIFLLSSTSAIAAGLLSNNDSSVKDSTSMSTSLLNLNQAIQWIDDNCDRRFLHAVVSSDYQFLYRGGPQKAKNKKGGFLLTEKPDLLSTGTYPLPQTDDALLYFQELENLLASEKVKPSNGHLTTTSIEDAAQWGDSYSVWPLQGAHYIWLENKGLFFPPSGLKALSRNDFIVDGRDCGKMSLEDALCAKKCEVMINSSENMFLMVPASMDEELKNLLKNSYLV